MNKKVALLIIFSLILTSTCAIGEPNTQSRSRQYSRQETETTTSGVLDKNTIYYPNANIKSAIAKYKNGNYSGCLQELFSLTKKDPSNAVAYYYMAMAYTHVNMKDEAVAAYEKVLSLSPNSYIAEYAEKGRDCLTDGPKCHPEASTTEEQSELDKFINSPYGNGLSDKVNNEVKQKELDNIKDTINKKNDLEHRDIQKIKNFDNSKTYNQNDVENTEKIAVVSDEEILKAVKTLKDAGLNLTVQQDNPYAQMMQYQDPKMAEINMLLGNNNNNNNSMMNMLPMLMSKSQSGENIDPRFMQAMMMNSMMSDLDFTGNNNNNRY